MSTIIGKKGLGYLIQPVEDIGFISQVRIVGESISIDNSELLVFFNHDSELYGKSNIFVEYKKSSKIEEIDIEGKKRELTHAQEVNNKFFGQVKFFASDKGFGIIDSAYGEFFIHVTNILNGNFLEEESLVAFESNFEKDKFQAINCEMISRVSRLNNQMVDQLEYMVKNYGLKPFLEQTTDQVRDSVLKIIPKVVNNEELLIHGLKKNIDLRDVTILRSILFTDSVFRRFSGPDNTVKKEGLIGLVSRLRDNSSFDYGVHDKTPKIEEIRNTIKSDDEFTNLIFKIFYEILDFKPKEHKLLIDNIFFLTDKCFPSSRQKLSDYIIGHTKDNFLIELWIDGYIDSVDVKQFLYLFQILDFDKQKLFFKKLFQQIHLNTQKIDIETILSLPANDIEEAESAKTESGLGLDYSISVIIDIISRFRNKTESGIILKDINQNIYHLAASFLNNLKEPQNIIEVTGFFDKCQGRCNVTANSEEDENGLLSYTDIELIRDEDDSLKSHYYCDGRRNRDYENGESLPDNKYGLEFWWCRNLPCFKPSRELHNPEDWREYTLQDLFYILNIAYNEDDYEILLGLINKANRFFEKLKCESCGSILMPLKQSNYGFWRISLFHCTKSDCSNNDPIYLSHCLNGRCDNIIDSRISKRCNYDNQNAPDYVSGMYICDKCSSCCNMDTLKRIQEKGVSSEKQTKSLEWRIDHKATHEERHEKFCFKCGSLMVNADQEYKRILSWFIKNKDANKKILASGIRKNDGKYWFRLKADKKQFNTLKKCGFNVKEDQYNNDTALVSEKFKEGFSSFYCANENCTIYFDSEKGEYSEYSASDLDYLDHPF